jgi:hypothetical protein
MNLIAERVKVTDASGHDVDIKVALNAPLISGTVDDGEVAADDDAEVMAETDPAADADASLAESPAEEAPAEEAPAKSRAKGKAKA